MARLPTLVMLCLAAPTAAEVLGPDAFEAMSEGRTLHFTQEGRPFGAEQFFPGRRSVWRFPDGLCETGVWHAEGDRVCFRYEGREDTLCWRFRRLGDRVFAALVVDGEELAPAVELSHTDTEPLPCPGPDVGT